MNNSLDSEEIKLVKNKNKRVNVITEIITDKDNNLKIIKNQNKNKSFIKRFNFEFFLKIIFSKKFEIIFIYLLLLISIILYFFSLKGCDEELYQCVQKKRFEQYVKYGIMAATSAIIFSIVFILSIIIKIHLINYLIYILIYIFIFLTNQGTDLKNHGTYNCILFIFIVVIFTIYFYLFYLLVKYVKKKNTKRKIFVFVLIILPFLPLIFKTNCKNWEYGLGNLKIENDKNENICEIEKPKICTIQLFDGLLDLSKIFRRSCKGIANTKEIFIKYLDDNKKNFTKYYYPLTNKLKLKNGKLSFISNKLVNIVLKKIGDGNSKEAKDKEIFVNFDENGKGNIEMKLKRNENLINQRRIIAKKEKVKFENIYMIYIDAISRNHFIRKLKKTSELIENLLYTNKNKKKEYKNYDAYQFFKYQNFDMTTIFNIIPMIFGNSRRANKGISLNKFLKEKGYITAGTHNSCNRELLPFPKELANNIEFIDYDHENFAMFCDPNFYEKRYKWALSKGKNSILRRCLYNRDTFEYCFDYILQFLEAYKNERKFFRMSFNDGHEGTQEVVKYMDDYLYNFLKIILTKYYTDKTVILIVSDHGGQIPGLYDIIFSQDRRIEKTLGTFFIIFPNKFDYDKNIVHINEQRLVTPYDIHDSILDFANVNVSEINVFDNKGQSILKEINGLSRNCENYKYSFSNLKTYCHCINYKK